VSYNISNSGLYLRALKINTGNGFYHVPDLRQQCLQHYYKLICMYWECRV